MSESKVTIKGTKDGLLITLGEGELTDCLAELEELLRSKAFFFKGGRVVLDVDTRELDAEEIQGIEKLLYNWRVRLWAVVSKVARTQAATRSLGLETDLHPRGGIEPLLSPDQDWSQGVLVRCTLRSGQSIQHAGHVVVIGDVNPGAEIVSGGDVIVWGKLRGIVHAGAMGNESAIVCALELSPTQLRIGNHIARSPEEKRERAIPEMASVRGDRIVAEAWFESG